MSSKKFHYLLLGILALVCIGIVGGAYLANSALKTSAKDLLDQKALGKALDAQKQQLAKDKRDIEKYRELNEIAQKIVPQDKDQAEAVRQIVKIAADSNIPHLSSVTFPSSTLGGTNGKATRGSNLTQLTAVKGISGVFTLPITVQVNEASAVPYSTLIKFLQGLEANRRTSQVSNINVTPKADSPGLVSFTLVIEEYIKP
jgi:Na+-translocating ferredoxin:NAD+ oxidoreductase RnfG subunit